MRSSSSLLAIAVLTLALSVSIGAGQRPIPIASGGCVDCSSCQDGHDTGEGSPSS